MIQKLRAIWPVFAKWNAYGRPPFVWVFRTSEKCDRRFALKNAWSFQNVATDDKFQYVTINKQAFVWPKNAPISSLIQLLSDLLQTDPHHYDVEPTRIGPGDIVLDIGACEGAFSAAVANKGAEIILSEPLLSMGDAINRTFEQRNLPAPRIFQCLLGENEKVPNFLDDSNNPGRSGPRVVRTLRISRSYSRLLHSRLTNKRTSNCVDRRRPYASLKLLWLQEFPILARELRFSRNERGPTGYRHHS